MTKADDFKYWCDVHKATLPRLHALTLAKEAVDELEAAYRRLQTCGNCGKLYEYNFSESHSTAPGSSWLACRDMDGYRSSVEPHDKCHFEDPHWTEL